MDICAVCGKSFEKDEGKINPEGDFVCLICAREESGDQEGVCSGCGEYSDEFKEEGVCPYCGEIEGSESKKGEEGDEGLADEEEQEEDEK